MRCIVYPSSTSLSLLCEYCQITTITVNKRISATSSLGMYTLDCNIIEDRIYVGDAAIGRLAEDL